MRADEFEDLLHRAGTTTGARPETLDRLVMATRRSRRPARQPVLIGLAVAVAVLLAAAATSDQWMKVAPFASLETDMYRTQSAIPVDFTMTDGQRVHCQAFLEYKYLSAGQAKQADEYVQNQDWSGLGQRLYDAGTPKRESYEDAQLRIYDALTPLLERVALTAVPTAVSHSPAAEDAHRPLVNGSATICRRVAS